MGNKDDVVIVPNVPLMTVAFELNRASLGVNFAINTALNVIQTKPFVVNIKSLPYKIYST